ncbi:MAG TPA: FAD binding domain-containing protein [Alphaproteobacteria bacterium]|nr:FAD binding domain-containing protein [Alphaproteobacteria bacterium]
MKPAKFEYTRPNSIEEALHLLAGSAGRGRLLAGGQSLGPMLNLRLAMPELVIDIGRIQELQRVEETSDEIILGAGICHADIEDGRVVDVARGLLRRVAGGIAHRAVRNRGTIGGSLAHADPAADWPPTMIALDAALDIRSVRGARRMQVADFVTGPLTTALAEDEMITAIRLRRFDAALCWGHCKISAKPGDFAEAVAIVAIDRARNSVRAVLAGRAQAPTIMPLTARRIAEKPGWTSIDGPAIKEAVRTDIHSGASVAPLPFYDLALFEASMARAAREALAA